MKYLLWSGILFSTAARALLVAKLVILGALFLTSFILTLRVLLVVTPATSAILYSIPLI